MSPADDVPDLAERRAERLIPPDVMDAAQQALLAQIDARGEWPNPRENNMPEAPWPAHENPILAYLFHRAKAQLEVGMDPVVVIEHVLVHAWFEGGIENYDRGRRDGLPE